LATNSRGIRKLICLCIAAAACGCAPQRYTYYEPTAANARFAPGHSCAGPHDLVIFPPERDGIQVGLLVGGQGPTPELWFEIRNDIVSSGLVISKAWREHYQAIRDHVFDVHAPSPSVKVTLADGTKLSFDIPYLANSEHRSYVAGKLQGVPPGPIKWPLPIEAASGFDVVLPDIFVDGKLIPTSPVHFARTTKVLNVGINC